MSALRPVIRWSALLTGLVLTTSLTVTTTSATAAPAPAAKPMATKPVASNLAARTGIRYQPPRNYVPYNGARFGYLGRGRAEQSRIRSQVLATINSTWGGPRDRYGIPLPTNGKIRIASWSFGDKTIGKALVAARNRGVSVQVMAAADINKSHPEWHWLKQHLGTRYYDTRESGSSDRMSFARPCAGSCRGRGGTPHAKFFLFDNVGANHARNIVFQTSMNLTTFAFRGQWNQAEVTSTPAVFAAFMAIFREMRPATYNASPFRDYVTGSIENIFFPLVDWNSQTDPVLRMLGRTSCTNAGVYNGRTHIRIIQYAIYQSRGEAIAKKLRQLWNAGCDIQIVYSVTTRPVLSILRNHSGRGAIPMKESIIRGSDGTIAKYNHSKWMTIAGNYGGKPAQWKTISGSANWANLALSSDEQMQILDGYATARAYLGNFGITWAQKTSGPPTLAYISEGRTLPLPEDNIPWGTGIYKHMQED
jgi:phosphatidylserine/phosphatidylglycerophosphate/cardiolipin synthase-like enzyme